MVFHRFSIERQACSLTTRFSTKQIVRYNDAQKGEAKMLQLTNIFMNFINRKLFITFMCAGLLIMAVGCNDENGGTGGCMGPGCNNQTNNDQNNVSNNAQNNVTNNDQPDHEIVEQEIVVQSKPLSYFTGKLKVSMQAKQLTIVEDLDRELTLQLVPSTNSTLEILNQYEAAYKRNYDLMNKLLTGDSPAVIKEKEALTEFYEQSRTLENVIVSKIIVFGTEAEIVSFETQLKE